MYSSMHCRADDCTREMLAAWLQCQLAWYPIVVGTANSLLSRNEIANETL